MAVSFPPSPIGDPTAPGPAGLEQAAAALFQQPGAPALGEPIDPYAALDPKFLLKRFETAKKDGQDLRWVFERQWWRNLLYVLGRQWIFFDVKRNEWRDKRLKKWIPKPVTNKMKEVAQSIRAMFSSVKLGTISRPNGADPKNIVTANTADGLQPLIHEEHEMDRVTREGDFWFIILGNVFKYLWWDHEGGAKVPITHEQCVACQTTVDPASLEQPGLFMCPSCGGNVSQPIEVGKQPVGKGMTDVVSPFEILLPSHASSFEECNKIIRIRWRPREYYEDVYPELAKTMKWEKAPTERSLHLFKSLAAQNDLSNTPFTWGSGQRGESEGMTEYEYWEKPSKQFPKGLFFRVVGETSPFVLEDPDQSSPGPIPCETIHGESLWPWIHEGYEPIGGRLWAAGAIDPLIQKQDQLNQMDSRIQLIVDRMANPIWLEPKGSEVEKFTGEPGLVVKYNLVGTTGQGKPERLEGSGPHASLFTIREQYLKDIEELAGTFDIIKGQKPTGVEAFSALQLLVERSQSRFTTAFNERGEGYRKWYGIALEFERKYGPTERSISLLGPNRTWAFRHFQQAHLSGQISIIVEDGTNMPKTSLGKRAAIEQANNLGLINPQDPDQQYAILSQFGLSDLIPSLDSSVKTAQREHDLFEKWIEGGKVGQPPLQLRAWDAGLSGEGIVVRVNELRKWANSDRMQEFMTKDPEIAKMLTFYYQSLMMFLQPMMAPQPGQPGQPGANGQPGQEGKPAQGTGRAMANSNQESGGTDTQPPANQAA